MGFPARFRTFTPEGYDDLGLKIQVNPTNDELLFLAGPIPEDAGERTRFGAALARSYDHAKIEAYGVTFDFSTPEAALATLDNGQIPDDLQYWLRNAPVEVVIREREHITKNYRAS
jgi:hypothetical protein